jgi:hypothetical protein
MPGDIIGYLFSKLSARTNEETDYVKCKDCMGQGNSAMLHYVSPLWEVNVLPYRQTCHMCSKTLVAGQSPAWCELYTVEPCPPTLRNCG